MEVGTMSRRWGRGKGESASVCGRGSAVPSFLLARSRMLILGSQPASIPCVNSIPVEAQPFALGTAIIGVLFLAALIRVWLLRRVETKLLKNRDALEKQVLLQQREIMEIRKDSAEWRTE